MTQINMKIVFNSEVTQFPVEYGVLLSSRLPFVKNEKFRCYPKKAIVQNNIIQAFTFPFILIHFRTEKLFFNIKFFILNILPFGFKYLKVREDKK